MIQLRFSKSGDPEVEKWYSTHFVDAKRIKELKSAKESKTVESAEVTEP